MHKTATLSAIPRLFPFIRAWWAEPAIRYPVLIFIVARVITLAIAASGTLLDPAHNPFADEPVFRASILTTQSSSPTYALLEPWHRWDTGWLMKIAGHGYAAGDGSIVFAPLYPLMIAVVNTVLHDTLLSALIVSSLSCLVYLLLLYRLAVRELGTALSAQYALLAVISFPTAFYLLAGYTESPFLAFTTGAIAAAFASRWWLASALALLAALTRTQGWVLFFPLGWLALSQPPGLWPIPSKDRRITWLRTLLPRLLATGAGPIGTAGTFAFFWFSGFGSVSDAYEQVWAMWIRPPWSAIIDLIGRMASGSAHPTEYGNALALAFIIAMMLLSVKRLSFVYHLYLWPTLFMILLRYYPLYLLNGTMRYVLDFFPIFFTAGALLNRYRTLGFWWLLLAALLQCLLLFLFTRWVWIA